MKILIVEDDYLQADSIYETLKQILSARIEGISTESEFRSRIQEIEKDPPDVVIMDVMLRWTDPSPELDLDLAPPDIRNKGFYRAGVRCAALLGERERTKNIPIIFYTILERADLEVDIKKLSRIGEIVHLRKESDADPLIDLINDLVRQRRP